MAPVWTLDVIRFAMMITLFVVTVAMHLAFWSRLLRVRSASPVLRLLGLLPPLSAIYAFRNGQRTRALVWFVLVAGYVAMRLADASTPVGAMPLETGGLSDESPSPS